VRAPGCGLSPPIRSAANNAAHKTTKTPIATSNRLPIEPGMTTRTIMLAAKKIRTSWIMVMRFGLTLLLCRRPCTGACRGERCKGGSYHGVRKPDRRISVKEYRRGKNLKVLLAEVPFAPARQFRVTMNGARGPASGRPGARSRGRTALRQALVRAPPLRSAGPSPAPPRRWGFHPAGCRDPQVRCPGNRCASLATLARFIDTPARFLTTLARFLTTLARFLTTLARFLTTLARFLTTLARFLATLAVFMTTLDVFLGTLVSVLATLARCRATPNVFRATLGEVVWVGTLGIALRGRLERPVLLGFSGLTARGIAG
jgi:hypothetical protein